jgi:hypothetical protein
MAILPERDLHMLQKSKSSYVLRAVAWSAALLMMGAVGTGCFHHHGYHERDRVVIVEEGHHGYHDHDRGGWDDHRDRDWRR